MAYFGIEYKDGKQYALEHPCFAWVGDVAYDQRNDKTYGLGDRVAVFFQCQSKYKKGTRIVYEALLESPMAAMGVKYVYCDGKDAEGAFKTWANPHIRMEVSVDEPGWKYFMLTKMSAKTASYGRNIADALVDSLVEGATFAEAFVLAKVNGHMTYNYPTLYFGNKKEEFLGFLRDNVIPDWSEYSSETFGEGQYSRPGNALPFKDCGRFGSTAPDQPYNWEKPYGKGPYTPKGLYTPEEYIFATTIAELRETYGYTPVIKAGK